MLLVGNIQVRAVALLVLCTVWCYFKITLTTSRSGNRCTKDYRWGWWYNVTRESHYNSAVACETRSN